MIETSPLLVALCLALCVNAATAHAGAARAAPREVDEMLSEVSPARVRALVDTLASFGTRHTLSETESDTRGIGAARRWIKAEFERYGQESGRRGEESMKVLFDVHRLTPDGRRIDVEVDVMNVMAILPGAMPEARERLYYIIAHYDSINADVMNRVDDAPGANDSASGVAALMELARVMSKRRYDATLVFMATAGEEQGLYGARLHARAAREAGHDIRAVLNNDTVGDPVGEHARDSDAAAKARRTIRIFSEGVSRGATTSEIAQIALLGAESDGPARQIARYLVEIAELHDLAIQPTMVFRNDRFLRGGDHTGFLEAGFAASVRVTVPHEDYARQHAFVRTMRDDSGQERRIGDLPEFVEEAYLADVTRLNGAALAHLANAPSEPPNARLITAQLTNDTTLRWSPSPEPDVAGYELVWRETTSPVWTHVKDVGNVTEATLEVSKDSYLFGVRAYDRDGYRSPVSFPIAARE